MSARPTTGSAARAAVEAAIEQVDRELPPHELGHYRGRLVVDLRPRSAGGKREAFEELLARERPATVVAFGDDVSDADGFGVLRAARTAGTSGGLAVAVTGPHGMPDEVHAAADVVLDTPFDAARALSALAAVLERETAPARDPSAPTHVPGDRSRRPVAGSPPRLRSSRSCAARPPQRPRARPRRR